jgi:hypothetical protein
MRRHHQVQRFPLARRISSSASSSDIQTRATRAGEYTMRHRERRLASILVGLAVIAPRQASAQGDTALRNWEPATITQRRGARADTESGRSGSEQLTPDALQGPPTPATMYAIAILDADQLNRYLAAYRAHMGATWDARYGVASAVRFLDRAVDQRNEDAARYYTAVAERLWTKVAAQDRSFDDVVNTMLRKDQRRRYQDWKDRLARGAAEQGRLERALPPG